jgi:7-cyano-7-deazaguanine synthase
MQRHALEGMGEIKLYTPYVRVSKADIAAEGAKLGVDSHQILVLLQRR